MMGVGVFMLNALVIIVIVVAARRIRKFPGNTSSGKAGSGAGSSHRQVPAGAITERALQEREEREEEGGSSSGDESDARSSLLESFELGAPGINKR